MRSLEELEAMLSTSAVEIYWLQRELADKKAELEALEAEYANAMKQVEE